VSEPNDVDQAPRWPSRARRIIVAVWLLLLAGSYFFPVWVINVYPGGGKAVPLQKRVGRRFRFVPPTPDPEFVDSAKAALAPQGAGNRGPYTVVRTAYGRFEGFGSEALALSSITLFAVLLLRILSWRAKRKWARGSSQGDEH
jgi:hypothetical protein